MPNAPVRWGSLVTDPDGEINYTRIFKLIAALAGVLGICLALFATIWQLAGNTIADKTLIGWIITALVLPITGGTAAGGITGALLRRNGNGNGGPYVSKAL